eukprot:SAG22_NODE_1332_length_4702_cov_1.577232_2_plen_803_part_00
MLPPVLFGLLAAHAERAGPVEQWAGPAKLIFAASQCMKTGTNTTAGTPADCERACAAAAHCNAINFNSGSHPTGGRCNLHCCAKPVVPSWAVTSWVSYNNFAAQPACTGEHPAPPPPPPPPGSQGVLVKLTAAVASHGARCLDGTPAAYYFSKGTGSGADKWVVYLNGGGWCWSESEEWSDTSQSCWGRAGGGLGTSNGLPPTRTNARPSTTPMANWNQANVIYCDGGSFSGNREDPVVTPQYRWPNGSTTGPNKTLFYRGQRNLNAIVDDLKAKGMQGAGASLAVLGGCSAGAMAALAQCNHFASRAGVPSKCVGDAGFFIDTKSLYQFPTPFALSPAIPAGAYVSLTRRQYTNLVRFMNSSLDAQCEAHADTNTYRGACFYPQNCLKHSETPMFLRNSMYNYGEWEMTSTIWTQGASVTPDWGANIGCGKLGNGSCSSSFGCCNVKWKCQWECPSCRSSRVGNFAGCDASHLSVIKSFQTQWLAAAAPALDPASKHGVFADTCTSCHCIGMWSDSFSIGNVSRPQALGAWLLQDQAVKLVAEPLLKTDDIDGTAAAGLPPGPWPRPKQSSCLTNRGTGTFGSATTIVATGAGAKTDVVVAALLRYKSIIVPQDLAAANLGTITTVTVDVASADDTLSSSTDYSYTLAYMHGGGDTVAATAAGPFGVAYALETLSQTIQEGGVLPCSALSVQDAPEYVHRGLMIDTGRRFYPMALVKQIVDGLALSKMNVLHFHLSEECFRVESLKYPALTAPDSCVQSNGNNTAFYSQDEITELVAYARLRGVRVLPEFGQPPPSAFPLP